MGRKGSWFSSVKKALSPDQKEPKELTSSKSKKKWFGKQKHVALDLGPTETTLESVVPPLPLPHREVEEVKLTEEGGEENAPIVANTSTESVAQVAPQIVTISTVSRFSGKSKEEIAVIRIQTAFRGYQARRALRALRGLVRLKLLIEGPAVKRQVNNTMKCMQTLARLQSQIHSRRMRMLEENQALQRQLMQKRVKELESMKIGEEWDDSLQSKEQIEAGLLKKFEAAMRRERALAYAFTHQKMAKNQGKSMNLMFLDPNNPTWGWSWLERWTAARPWEKDATNNQLSTKGTGVNIAGEISKSYARYQLNSDKNNSPTASQKSTNFNSFTSPSVPSKPVPPSVPRNKLKPTISPRSSIGGPEDDSKSMVSIHSEHTRRHSIGVTPSVHDDESLASSPSVPSYMVATQSARAKSRLQSLSVPESNEKPEKVSPAVAKKRLSFPPSPGRPRRHSGPPKVNTSIISENSMASGVAS
ncbi:hypothetical protein SAY86_030270 [Trapa natans]|uniref:DUF4005 domain-containing protein n=1 Tax=Trapa natans TaxID=22666 RepID=A0AAN7RAF8_TRANT|nr:hypothetical protein SAY86_030270 [Trapa natans]